VTLLASVAKDDSPDVTELDPSALRLRAALTLSATPRPFLRWAGSKRALLGHIVEALPRSYGRYYEPFLGGGALFFLLRRGERLGSAAIP
jgi:DNA adenine methylase